VRIKIPVKLRDEPNAVRMMERYFAVDPRTGRVRDSAAYFERLGGGGDRPETAHQITAEDLLAVNMLGTPVDGYYALQILEDQAGDISALLAQIPPDVKLTDDGAADLIAEGGPAWQLWEPLRAIKRPANGRLGRVAASKLLARKRPHLIPVYDSHVKGTIGRRPNDQTYWTDLRSLLTTDDAPVRELETIRTRAEVGHLSLLRTLDVLFWMYYSA
jgi:hypothetical protein